MSDKIESPYKIGEIWYNTQLEVPIIITHLYDAIQQAMGLTNHSTCTTCVDLPYTKANSKFVFLWGKDKGTTSDKKTLALLNKYKISTSTSGDTNEKT